MEFCQIYSQYHQEYHKEARLANIQWPASLFSPLADDCKCIKNITSVTVLSCSWILIRLWVGVRNWTMQKKMQRWSLGGFVHNHKYQIKGATITLVETWHDIGCQWWQLTKVVNLVQQSIKSACYSYILSRKPFLTQLLEVSRRLCISHRWDYVSILLAI